MWVLSNNITTSTINIINSTVKSMPEVPINNVSINNNGNSGMSSGKSATVLS